MENNIKNRALIMLPSLLFGFFMIFSWYYETMNIDLVGAVIISFVGMVLNNTIMHSWLLNEKQANSKEDGV